MNSISSFKITLTLFFVMLFSIMTKAEIIIDSPTVHSGGVYNADSSTYIVCEGQTIIFDYIVYSTIGETLNLNSTETNLNDKFGAGNVTVLVQHLDAVAFDSLQIYVQITSPTPTNTLNGVYNDVNLAFSSTSESKSIQFDFVTPYAVLSSPRQYFCANTSQSIDLIVSPNSGLLDISSTSWSQTQGTTAAIVSSNSATTKINISALTQYDSLTFQNVSTIDPSVGVTCSTITKNIKVYADYLSVTGTDTRTECDSLVWIDGNTYYSSNNSATYNIVGGATNGCDSLVTLNLTINSVSDVTTSTSGTTITANNTGATYQWLNCDISMSSINNETNASFTAISQGNYAVALTENGCKDTSDCISITISSVLENNFKSQVLVYPNPSSGAYTIDLGEQYQNVMITVTNMLGEVILSDVNMDGQFVSFEIAGSTGIYLLKIESGNMTSIAQIVKK